MNFLYEFLSSDPAHRLGWTLAHSLWGGVLVAGVLVVLLAVIPRRMSRARYAAGCLALLALVVGLGITFVFCSGREADAPPAHAGPTAPAMRSAESAEATGQPIPPPTQESDREAAASGAASWSDRLIDRARALVPWLVPAWFIGVLSLSVWHLGGWVAIRQLRAVGTLPIPSHLAGLLRDLAGRLSVRRPVELVRSAVARWPMAIGWVKPVILVPAGLLNGLSPDQLEAILAHELAHIRRYDYLVNLLQTVVETLLFHHPAVWWISRKIRNQREHCCDDAVVELTSNRLSYAEALTAIAESGPASPHAAVAADGGSLLSRIRRILRVDDRRRPGLRSSAGWTLAAVMFLTVAITFSLGTSADKPGRDARSRGKAPAVRKLRRVTLPHADRVRDKDTPAVLDLATGRMLVQPKTADDAKIARYWAELGRGDVAFPGEGLLVLRRATVQRWNAATRRFEPAKPVYRAPKNTDPPLATGYSLESLPLRFLITTAEGKQFDLKILRKAEAGGVEVEYRPTRRKAVDSAPWGKAVDGIQVRLRPTKLLWTVGDDPTFEVDIRNGGTRKLKTRLIASVALEVNGRPYAPLTWFRTGRIEISPFGPGARYTFKISLGDFAVPDKNAKELSPGRYKIQVVYLNNQVGESGIYTSLGRYREMAWAYSNPVEITIAPKDSAKATTKPAVAGCKTPEELARFVVESLSKGDLASLIKRAVFTNHDVEALMGRLREVLKDAPRHEYPPPFGGGPGKGWHAKEIYADWVRFATRDFGVDWAKAKFERAEYRIVKAKGIVAAGAVDVIFSAGGKRYRMVLDDCYLTDRGWLMADGPVWKGATAAGARPIP